MNQVQNDDKPVVARFTSDGDFTQVQRIDSEGRISRAAPVPFYVLTLFGWRPVCVKHKLRFFSDGQWYAHYTRECDSVKDYPSSDLAYKLPEPYRRIWPWQRVPLGGEQ